LFGIIFNKRSIKLATAEILNALLKECAQKNAVLYDIIMTITGLFGNVTMIIIFWRRAFSYKWVIDFLIRWVLSIVEFNRSVRIEHIFGDE
jgi:hypothetical protein